MIGLTDPPSISGMMSRHAEAIAVGDWANREKPAIRAPFQIRSVGLSGERHKLTNTQIRTSSPFRLCVRSHRLGQLTVMPASSQARADRGYFNGEEIPLYS